MVKCPICGEDVSYAEYMKHYDSHQSGEPWTRILVGTKGVLEENLHDMLREADVQIPLNFIMASLEALVEVGRLYEQKGYKGLESIYNNIAIAVNSAYEGRWGDATRFTQMAIEATRDF